MLCMFYHSYAPPIIGVSGSIRLTLGSLFLIFGARTFKGFGWFYLMRFYPESLSRLPFELNSTFRYALVCTLRVMDHLCFTMVFNTALAYVFGIIMYTEAIFLDIQSLFNRIDKLYKSKDSNAELRSIEYVKEVISVHSQIIGWVFDFSIFPWTPTINFRFLVVAWNFWAIWWIPLSWW